MLGWQVNVYRLKNGSHAGSENSRLDMRIATWETEVFGLTWLDDLVDEGNILSLKGNGYPDRYTGQAKHLLPQILNGPPMSIELWSSGSGDILTDKWEGRTTIDTNEASNCSQEEWLMVEAWDLS